MGLLAGMDLKYLHGRFLFRSRLVFVAATEILAGGGSYSRAIRRDRTLPGPEVMRLYFAGYLFFIRIGPEQAAVIARGN